MVIRFVSVVVFKCSKCVDVNEFNCVVLVKVLQCKIVSVNG